MKKSIRQLLLIGLCISCAFQNDTLMTLDQYIEKVYEQGNFEGSIVVGNLEGEIYTKQIGMAVREWEIPVQPDTRFDIASLNKSFVGFMIMQLVEAEVVSLSDPISLHLDFQDTVFDNITIHQMLTHTSGLPDYDGIPDSLKQNRFETFKRVHFNNNETYLNFIEGLPRIGEPGGQFYYSNFAYHVLSILIEEKTGMHFSKALDSMICQPLGLSETYAPVDNYTIYPRVALPYENVDGTYQRSAFIDYSLGRRIFSTASDLYKWGKENQSPTLIAEESKKQIQSNHIGSLNPQVSYGYGWVVFDGNGEYKMGRLNLPKKYLIHGGATDGYRSLLLIYNEGEWIVSLTGNIGDQINELKMVEELMNILIKQ